DSRPPEGSIAVRRPDHARLLKTPAVPAAPRDEGLARAQVERVLPGREAEHMAWRTRHSGRPAAAENVDATGRARVVLHPVTGNEKSSGEAGERSRSRYAASDDRHRLVPACPWQR